MLKYLLRLIFYVYFLLRNVFLGENPTIFNENGNEEESESESESGEEEEDEEVFQHFQNIHQNFKSGKKSILKARRRERKNKRKEANQYQQELYKRKKKREEMKKRQKEFELKEKEKEQKKEEEIEKKRREKEYLEWGHLFTVKERGFTKKKEEMDSNINEFIEFVKKEKIVDLSDLSERFSLTIRKAMKRIEQLEEQGLIHGVLSQRGKYVYLEKNEISKIKGYIYEKGKVSVSEIQKKVNKVILNTIIENSGY